MQTTPTCQAGKIVIKRGPADYEWTYADFDDLEDIHWCEQTGGIKVPTPYPMIMAKIKNENLIKEVACTGIHDHSISGIKVCVIKKYTDPEEYKKLIRNATDRYSCSPIKKKYGACMEQIRTILQSSTDKSITRMELKDKLSDQFTAEIINRALDYMAGLTFIGSARSPKQIIKL